MSIKIRSVSVFLGAALTLGMTSELSAATVLTGGAGSAVTDVDASADFEHTDALFDNPYLEGGLSFSRTNLSFNNNGCGFAGCTHAPQFENFDGNYVYGVSSGDGAGFFEISAGTGLLSGLEFIVSSGHTSYHLLLWTTFKDGLITSTGTSGIVLGSIIGFSDDAGFDTLRFTMGDGSDTSWAPAFDSVRAQYTQVVPIPAALPLFGTALAAMGLVGWIRRRKLAFG